MFNLSWVSRYACVFALRNIFTLQSALAPNGVITPQSANTSHDAIKHCELIAPFGVNKHLAVFAKAKALNGASKHCNVFIYYQYYTLALGWKPTKVCKGKGSSQMPRACMDTRAGLFTKGHWKLRVRCAQWDPLSERISLYKRLGDKNERSESSQYLMQKINRDVGSSGEWNRRKHLLQYNFWKKPFE